MTSSATGSAAQNAETADACGAEARERELGAPGVAASERTVVRVGIHTRRRRCSARVRSVTGRA